MQGKDILSCLNNGKASQIFKKLYGVEGIEDASSRYGSLIEEYTRNTPDWFPHSRFPEAGKDISVFSAPGRTELGGNHTDHNHGKVLAASIHLDAVAIAAPRDDKKIFYRSKGHEDVEIDISDLSIQDQEKGTACAMFRGIAAEFSKLGIPVRGFSANADSRVLTGSGLSSSAALEVLIGCIFNNFFGEGKLSAIEIAKIGQKAENNYFGKPCGLMDQTACATGGAISIDFADPSNPDVKKMHFDPAEFGTYLCVVDTKGSHSDLTDDYAAIPSEMKAVASFLGKTVLRELEFNTIIEKANDIRKALGDRALLRALHFFLENERVDFMMNALEKIDKALLMEDRQRLFGSFVQQANNSGDSSWKLLQNIYSPHYSKEQGISLALAVTHNFLEKNNTFRGACRVHGGGFAGTIQAYIPINVFSNYVRLMETLFGTGCVTVLSVRDLGVTELDFA